MISPICYVNNAPIPVNVTTGVTGVNVAAGSTVTISLANSAGVNVWNINCTATDGFNPVSTVALVQATKLQTNYSCTFVVPAMDGYVGASLQFTSNVNNVSGLTTTLGIFVLNHNNSRLFFPNENLETNLYTGVAYDLNALLASTMEL